MVLFQLHVELTLVNGENGIQIVDF